MVVSAIKDTQKRTTPTNYKKKSPQNSNQLNWLFPNVFESNNLIVFKKWSLEFSKRRTPRLRMWNQILIWLKSCNRKVCTSWISGWLCCRCWLLDCEWSWYLVGPRRIGWIQGLFSRWWLYNDDFFHNVPFGQPICTWMFLIWLFQPVFISNSISGQELLELGDDGKLNQFPTSIHCHPHYRHESTPNYKTRSQKEV